MAYADTIRTVNPTMEDVATLIEGFLWSGYGFADVTGSVSTTSTSLVDITSTSVSVTVGSGDRVLLIGTVTYSGGTVGADAAFSIARDGTALGTNDSIDISVSNTTGYAHSITVVRVDTSMTTGAHTYSIQWAISTGTLYGDKRKLWAIPFQYS